MAYKIETTKNSSSADGRPYSDWLQDLLKKDIPVGRKGMSTAQKQEFYFEMALLIRSGVSLKDALSLIVEQQKKEARIKEFTGIQESLSKGFSLSGSVEKVPGFSKLEIQTLAIGEQTGQLLRVLEELAAYFATRNESKKAVIQALSYPIIIVTTALVVLGFMLRYVVPMFADIFTQNKVPLPWITQRVIAISEFTGNYGGALLLFCIALGVLIRWAYSHSVMRGWIQENLLRIPFYGEYLREMHLARFSGTLQLVTSAGIPLVNGLEMIEQVIAFYPLQSRLRKISNGLVKGGLLSEEMEKVGFFDSKTRSLIKVGEATSDHESVLSNLTLYYQSRLKSRSKSLSTLLEPFIILFVGLFVGVVLISMYLPMFQLGQVLG